MSPDAISKLMSAIHVVYEVSKGCFNKNHPYFQARQALVNEFILALENNRVMTDEEVDSILSKQYDWK